MVPCEDTKDICMVAAGRMGTCVAEAGRGCFGIGASPGTPLRDASTHS